MSNFCYNPIKSDNEVLSFIKQSPAGENPTFDTMKTWNKYVIAATRGYYDELNENQKFNDQLPVDQQAAILAEFVNKLNSEKTAALLDAVSSIEFVSRQLRTEFPGKTKGEVVSAVAGLFSEVVDLIANKYPHLDRFRILQGVKVGDKVELGIPTIFSMIRADILRNLKSSIELYKKSTDDGDKARLRQSIALYTKINENFTAITSEAKVEIGRNEAVSIGIFKNYVANLTEEYSQEPIELNDFNEEESTLESWQEMSDSRSAIGSMSKEVRAFLSRIPLIENGRNKKNILGRNAYAKLNEVHETLQLLLSHARYESEMIASLKVSGLPYADFILKRFSEDASLLTQFTNHFSLTPQIYNVSAENVTNGVTTSVSFNINENNGNSEINKYKARLKEGKNKSEKSIITGSGRNLIIDKTKFEELTDKISAFADKQISENATVAEIANAKRGYQTMNRAQRIAALSEIFEMLDIPVNKQEMHGLVANRRDFIKVVTLLRDINNNIFKNLDNKQTAKLNKGTLNYNTLLTLNKGTDRRGTLNKKLSQMLKIKSKYNPSSSMIESKGYYMGKNFMTFVRPSFMSNLSDRIKFFANNNDMEGLRAYFEKNYLCSSSFKKGEVILSGWIKKLLESDINNERSFLNNFSITKFLGEEKFEFKSFSERKHTVEMILHYFAGSKSTGKEIVLSQEVFNRDYKKFTNELTMEALDGKTVIIKETGKAYKYNGSVNDNGVEIAWKEVERNNSAEYHSFIYGDANASKYIRAERYSREELTDLFFDVYIQEKQRMLQVKLMNESMDRKGLKRVASISNTENKFTFLTFLNDDFTFSDGSKMVNKIDPSAEKESFVKALDEYFEKYIQYEINEIEKTGALEINKQGIPRYLSQIINTKAIKDGNTRELLDASLEDFLLNFKYAMIQQFQLFSIDPGFFKSSDDAQKRKKQDHASGDPLSIEAIDPFSQSETPKKYSEDGYMSMMIFNEVKSDASKTNSEFMEVITSIFGEDVQKLYKSNTETDGQAYRTLEGYRKVLGMGKKWTRQMEDLYNLVNKTRQDIRDNNGVITEAQMEVFRKALIVFQPIKPFAYGFQDYPLTDSDTMKIPMQYKCSESLVIPELLPEGSRLAEAVRYAEENKIDVIACDSTIKVGAFGQFNIKDGDIIENMKKGYVHKLSYDYYLIQTNVPFHIGGENLFGTQPKKLIFNNMDLGSMKYSSYVDEAEYVLSDGRSYKMDGHGIVALFNSLVSANIDESTDMFGANISTAERVSRIITQNIATQERELKEGIYKATVNEQGETVVPLYEGTFEHQTSSLLMSMVKKMINKQTIKGGSAVQMSPYGVTKVEDDNLSFVRDLDANGKKVNNILYAEIERTWDLTYKDANGHEVYLEQKDWCNTDGSLKLGKAIPVNSPKYKWYQSYKDANGVVRMPLVEESFPGILTVLAYRIPTEREYSMISAKVVRFSSPIAGYTIKVPPQGTTIAGFDFDIDKLYFMLIDHRERRLTAKERADEILEFYKANPDLWRVLREARKTEADAMDLLAKLFDGRELLTEEEAEESSPENRSLNSFWKTAGLPGTFADAFNEFRAKRKKVFETYDNTLAPSENSREARNNMLINLMIQRLSDPETIKRRLTPGGFETAKKAARAHMHLMFNKDVNAKSGDIMGDVHRIMEGKNPFDPKPNYDLTSPSTVIKYNQQNIIAGELIGIFVNHNVNHSLMSLVESFSLVKPIEFAGRSFSDLKNPPKDGSDTYETLAEMQTSSVDAVKEPVLKYLNLNTVTADMATLLGRLGYSFDEIGLLFNQPIVKDICNYCFNGNSSDFNFALKEVIKEYGYQNLDDIKGLDSNYLTSNALAKNIVSDAQGKRSDNMNDAQYKAGQAAVANLLMDINTASGDIALLARITKMSAANAIDSNFGCLYNMRMKIRSFEMKSLSSNSPLKSLKVSFKDYTPAISNSDEAVSPFHPFGHEQTMFNSYNRSLEYLSKYYPYERRNYFKSREIATTFSRSGIIDADTINRIHKELPVYMLSQMEDSPFNPNTMYDVERGYTFEEYFKEHFSTELYERISSNPDLLKMPIFEYMDFNTIEYIDENGETKEKIVMTLKGATGMSPIDEQLVIDSWATIAWHKDENLRRIATDLFYYNFHTLGFGFGYSSFIRLTPTAVLEGLTINPDGDTYLDFIRGLNTDAGNQMSESTAREFVYMYALNHLDENKIVFNINSRGLKTYIDNNRTEYSVELSMDDDEISSFVTKVEEVDGEDIYYFRPIFVVNNEVFALVDETGSLNNKFVAPSEIRYVKVNQLGQSNKSLSYNSSNVIFTKPIATTRVEDAEDPQADSNLVNTNTVETSVNESRKMESPSEDGAIVNNDEKIQKLRAAGRDYLIDTFVEFIASQTYFNTIEEEEASKAQQKAEMRANSSVTLDALIEGILEDKVPVVDGNGNPIC